MEEVFDESGTAIGHGQQTIDFRLLIAAELQQIFGISWDTVSRKDKIKELQPVYFDFTFFSIECETTLF